MPGEYFLDVPASAYVIGIIEAVPKPTSENPAIANQNLGITIASAMPDMINVALTM